MIIAGWYDKLDVPGNISIIALPAKCPELNPVENIWQFMRKLIDQPWRIMTIGHRKWASGL